MLTREALRFAALHVRVELGQIARRPWSRFAGRALAAMVLLCGGAAIIMIGGFAGAWVQASIIAAVVMLTIVLTWMILTFSIEARNYARAHRCWLSTAPAGSAGAYATCSADGSWTLMSVTARPQGRGLGGQLMHTICAQADFEAAPIVLNAINDAAARFYNRYAFTAVKRGYLGLQMIRFPAN